MNQPSNKLLCPENQILLDYLLKEHNRAPYTGRGPYYAAALRKVSKTCAVCRIDIISLALKVISSVTECAFPLRTLEQMSSLHGAGKVLSQKLWEIHNSTSGEGVASQPASMRTANLPVDKRARSSEYRPERGKGPWWTLHALHGLNGSGTKSEVQGYISRIQHELTV